MNEDKGVLPITLSLTCLVCLIFAIFLLQFKKISMKAEAELRTGVAELRIDYKEIKNMLANIDKIDKRVIHLENTRHFNK